MEKLSNKTTKPKEIKKKTKLEISSGGVVFRRTESGPRILLIKDSYGRWALPKGKIEKGETPKMAAVREIQEETGLSDLKIMDQLGQVKYFYRLHHQPIFKIVYHFLIESEQGKLKPNHEIQDARWFKPIETTKKVAYKNIWAILQNACIKLRKLEEKRRQNDTKK
jgi:8-oxo-dGTP pyrophosphatase MutT (NUDIX family)